MPLPVSNVNVHRNRVADQIVDDLRGQILSGVIEDGARLPSERDLASQYGVSVPTVREAVRVLSAMGLLNARNGSRATVRADGSFLLAMSIASVVQFDGAGAVDVIGLLRMLNVYAVELAVESATDIEIAELVDAAENSAEHPDIGSSAEAVIQFFTTLSRISHNPVVAALCRVLTEFQIGLAVELSQGNRRGWIRLAGTMHGQRMEIAGAIANRDKPLAMNLIRQYHDVVLERLHTAPVVKQVRRNDPALSKFLSSWLSANVRVGARLH
ncbi:FadR/GntR family transcriptional regulator [Rhodococcus sp. NPDC060176]|uniref:FadR/GntR family transcriptional regulator n=1 Tax=Rhodococcus sp. NPDC060176 TaxID=3347062 RepID=UPI00365542CF